MRMWQCDCVRNLENAVFHTQDVLSCNKCGSKRLPLEEQGPIRYERTAPAFYTREELVQLLVRKLLERPFKSRQLRCIAREILGVAIYFVEGQGYVSAVDYERFVKPTEQDEPPV